MDRRQNKAYHFAVACLCILLTGVFASMLDVNYKGAGGVVIAVMFACSIGGINTFFYYLVTAVIEAVCFLIYSIAAKNFTYMLIPLVPIAFSILVFAIQVIEFNIGARKDQ